MARDRTHVVYYGIDAARFGAIDADERAAARRALACRRTRPLALFVGALGDRRKGFDTVFDAWRALCGRADWDVDLVVTGTGAELEAWQRAGGARAAEGRIRFLGFRRDMPSVFAACDVLVHPARYEAYGLAVHEALCRGLPALVTAAAGVAERYPEDLGDLLLQDPASAAESTARCPPGVRMRSRAIALLSSRRASAPALGITWHGRSSRSGGVRAVDGAASQETELTE